MLEIKSLDNTSEDVLYRAFSEAFKDYGMPSMSRQDFLRLIHRRGFQPDLSFGAFDNGQLVSFTYNGIGNWEEKKTAYDTGTGTIETFRGKGLARDIFRKSITPLAQAGVQQYLLEVLQENIKAVSLYKSLGFEVTREFNYFIAPDDRLKVQPITLPEGFTCERIDLSYRKQMESFMDFKPSWQNSFEAVSRSMEDFIMIGMFEQDKLRGYGIIEPATGDITHLAVERSYRMRGLGLQLLLHLNNFNKKEYFKIINTEIDCIGMTHFMEKLGVPVTGTQFEMLLEF